MAAPTLSTVDGPRGPIAYRRWGEGPAVILAAGLGSRMELWGELPRLLARRFMVLTPDNRGVGGSRGGAPFTLEGGADDIAVVAAHAGLGRASVLGVSMGGLIACLAAARHPGLVDKLVAASCASHLTPSHRRVLHFFEVLMTRLTPAEAGEALMTFAFGATFADRYPGFVEQAAALYTLDEADIPGAREQVRSLQGGWDLRPALSGVRCPALVLAGELDPLVSPSSTREIAEAIPEARYREVPRAAHSVLAEGGAVLLDEVIEFLAA